MKVGHEYTCRMAKKQVYSSYVKVLSLTLGIPEMSWSANWTSSLGFLFSVTRIEYTKKTTSTRDSLNIREKVNQAIVTGWRFGSNENK